MEPEGYLHDVAMKFLEWFYCATWS